MAKVLIDSRRKLGVSSRKVATTACPGCVCGDDCLCDPSAPILTDGLVRVCVPSPNGTHLIQAARPLMPPLRRVVTTLDFSINYYAAQQRIGTFGHSFTDTEGYSATGTYTLCQSTASGPNAVTLKQVGHIFYFRKRDDGSINIEREWALGTSDQLAYEPIFLMPGIVGGAVPGSPSYGFLNAYVPASTLNIPFLGYPSGANLPSECGWSNASSTPPGQSPFERLFSQGTYAEAADAGAGTFTGTYSAGGPGFSDEARNAVNASWSRTFDLCDGSGGGGGNLIDPRQLDPAYLNALGPCLDCKGRPMFG